MREDSWQQKTGVVPSDKLAHPVVWWGCNVAARPVRWGTTPSYRPLSRPGVDKLTPAIEMCPSPLPALLSTFAVSLCYARFTPIWPPDWEELCYQAPKPNAAYTRIKKAPSGGKIRGAFKTETSGARMSSPPLPFSETIDYGRHVLPLDIPDPPWTPSDPLGETKGGGKGSKTWCNPQQPLFLPILSARELYHIWRLSLGPEDLHILRGGVKKGRGRKWRTRFCPLVTTRTK